MAPVHESSLLETPNFAQPIHGVGPGMIGLTGLPTGS
ncbi:hypothetical protein LVISKB_1316 [Levilactobacillus brevis KB290]|uniref:Uncharacterized protein n=1 Tax=Levilactobacillus brevis KB290 TaxID=1001583 RepID=M5B0F3_LEVBR|nr:hypothetical protein LVISKB_1316 [Levilactobacillus brevis KB290]